MDLPISPDDPLYSRQVELELYMQGRGAIRYRQAVAKAKERGRFSESDPGLVLLRNTVEPLADAIAQFVADSKSGSVGRKMLAAKLLDGQDARTVAFITARQCINFIQTNPLLSTAALKIGKVVEHEARFSRFAEKHPALFDSLLRHLDKRLSSDEHRRKAMSVMVGKFNDEWDGWTMTERIHLGVKLIELFRDSTGLIETNTVQVRRKLREKRITPSAKVAEWIGQRELRSELLLPFTLPMLAPPKPWGLDLKGGGYYSEAVPPLDLIKQRVYGSRQTQLLRDGDPSLVVKAVNNLQETRWKINKPVLDVLAHYWEQGFEVADLPANDDEPLPNKPHDIAENEEARKVWRKAAAQVHGRNAKTRAVRFQVSKTIEVARLFENEDALYFPYQLDFRGRVYAIGGGVNPQGADYSRAMLTFAEGKPILTETDARWLRIHGANCFGEDKISLDDRAQWVVDNDEAIINVARDPYTWTFWTEADKPWSFLAFCFEYAAFVEHGFGYVSSLPIALDGTCNGLQHFSAMLRDPVGGSATNLVPANRPNDIYQTVADVVIEKLKTEKAEDRKWMAQTWLQFGIDRKITKRPVMVLPYGGTRFACLKYVNEAFTERLGTDPSPFGEDTTTAITYLSGLVWDSIGDVVVAARAAMKWLQDVARIASKHVDHLHWNTPSGFPVVQAYRETKNRRVKTVMGDKFVFVSFIELTDAVDKERQVTGVSPNFVHSMDASALMSTVHMCKDNGIDSFAMIHDSYGTVAADTEVLAMTLRIAFVEMYRRDVLEEYRTSVLATLPDGVDLPPVPAMGELDIDRVLESPFFFS